MALPVGLALPG